MIAILATGLLVLLFSGVALAAALLISRDFRLAIERRVALVGHVTRIPITRLTPPPEASQTPAGEFNEFVRRLFTLGLAPTWGIRSSAGGAILMAAGSSAAIWLIAQFGLKFSAWLAVMAGIAGGLFLTRFLLLRQQAKTEGKFLTLFPDAIDMGVRMLRAGLPITSAIQAIGKDAPSPVNGIFRTLSDQVSIGIPFDEALTLTGERIGIADFRFFATAVALQRATGGNLAATLEILGDIIRKRRAVRLKAQATTAEVRVSAYILGAMPFFVIGALLLLQPRYLAPLIGDPRGKIIMGLATGLLVLGFVTMRRMMQSATRV